MSFETSLRQMGDGRFKENDEESDNSNSKVIILLMKREENAIDTLVLDYVAQYNDNDNDDSIVLFKILYDQGITNSKLFYLIPHRFCECGYEKFMQLFAATYHQYIDIEDIQGQSLLQVAVINKQYSISNILIDNDADVSKMTTDGNSLLHLLCSQEGGDERLIVDVMRSILRKDHSLINTRNKNDELPIFLACKYAPIECIKLLLNEHSDIDGVTAFNHDITDYILSRRRTNEILSIQQMINEYSIKNSRYEVERTNAYLSLLKFYQRLEKDEYITDIDDSAINDDELKQVIFSNEICSIVKKMYVYPKQIQSPSDFLSNRKKKYRILSLDGGGIKVLFQAIVISRLLEKYPNLLDECDLLCGCSASSYLISCIAIGCKIDNLEDIIKPFISQAFYKVNERFATLKNCMNPKYSNEYLKIGAASLYGDIVLQDVPKPIAILSFLIDREEEPRTSECCVFTNLNHMNDREKLSDICLRSSAAPSFFPSYQNYIDGGIIDNNPFEPVLHYLIGKGDCGLGIDVNDIVCLSISSTNSELPYIDGESVKDGGLLKWGFNISNAFLLARREQSSKNCYCLLGDKYLRFDPKIGNNIELDDVSKIDEVISFAKSVKLDIIEDWLNKYWYS